MIQNINGAEQDFGSFEIKEGTNKVVIKGTFTRNDLEEVLKIMDGEKKVHPRRFCETQYWMTFYHD